MNFYFEIWYTSLMHSFITILSSFLLLSSCSFAKDDTNLTSDSNNTAHRTPWVVDGYVLPPEPDPVVNNATLLGVDVNHNGVRDDVERWIYETYDEYVPCHQELYDHVMQDGSTMKGAREVCEKHPIPYHPIVRAVAMQVARAAQIIIQEPEKAKINKTYEVLDAAQDCEISIKHLKKRIYRNKEYAVIKKASLKEGNGLIEKLFNTTQRARAYAKYNYYLSGGIYSVPTDEEGLIYCDDNVKQLNPLINPNQTT